MGTGKSDKRRTVQEIAERRDIPLKAKRALFRRFGRLELRYTRTHCRSTLDESSDVGRYKVVAKNETNAVAVSNQPMLGEQIQHIRFEGKRYWICLGKFREYFKRVKKGRRMKTQQTRESSRK
jgi:hypothetical protein